MRSLILLILKWLVKGSSWCRLMSLVRIILAQMIASGGATFYQLFCTYFSGSTLIFLNFSSDSYNSDSLKLILQMLVLKKFLSASSIQNVSQNWRRQESTWVPQIKTWWKVERLVSELIPRPERLVFVRENCKQWKIWVFLAQNFSSSSKLLWRKCNRASPTPLVLPWW